MRRFWVLVFLLVLQDGVVSGSALDAWTRLPSPDTNQFNFTGLAYGNERHVAIKGRGKAYLSTDGVNWTDSTPTNFGPTSVDFVNNHFLVTGVSRIWTSIDGATWERRDIAPIPSVTLEGSTFGNGNYVIAGRTNIPSGGARPILLSSSDTESWNIWMGDGGLIRDVAFGNGTFVAVGSNPGHQSLFFTSTDATNWFPQTVPFSNIVYSVLYGGDRFVVVAAGASLTSTDGTNWNIHPYADSNAFASELAHGNGTFLGVGSFGQTNYLVSYSYDGGVTWKRNALGSRGVLEGASYADGRFYVSGGTNIWRSEHVSVPSLEAPQFTESNAQVQVTGEMGRSYILQSSTNLLDWNEVQMFTNSGPIHTIETQLTPSPWIFLRALIP